MFGPGEAVLQLKNKIKPIYKVTFLFTFIFGVLVHLPVMVRDIPNHDGLASMYFDQNMITSGRWFLTVACGFSSYYTLPWLISLLGLCFLAITAVLLTMFFETEENWVGVMMGALLVVFPTLSSTFCYVFTLDGYMMALLLAVLAAVLVERGKWGFLFGAVFLSLSLGIYQAYLPFTMLLCLYGVYRAFIKNITKKDKAGITVKYAAMGVGGLGLYYLILKILLLMEGKELSNYQGINGADAAKKESIRTILPGMYRNFMAFVVKGNVFTNNIFSKIFMIFLMFLGIYLLVKNLVVKKWYRSVWFYALAAVAVLVIPVVSNIMLLISPGVNYHILMRYHYVLFPMIVPVIYSKQKSNRNEKKVSEGLLAWGCLVSVLGIVFTYMVTDEVAYGNLQKKYEKTYAYCNRLLDRIEQTPGYYQGIPIAMIGVVSEDEYPLTDLTQKDTDGMIGMSGDYLLYTGANYQAFIANYLGATLNILPPQSMEKAYYEEFYRSMESFPGKDSIRIVDGIMYIKTENKE